MSLWRLITNPVTNWLREHELTRARQDQELALLDRTARMLEAAANDADVASLKYRGNSALRDLESGTGSLADVMSTEDYYTLIHESFDLWLKHATYGGAIDCVTNLVAGRDFDVSAERRELEPGEEMPEDEESAARDAEAYWWAFWRANEMGERFPEAVRRKLRDGDAFYAFADANRSGVWAEPYTYEGTEYVVPRFQFLDPAKVKNPSTGPEAGKHPYGVEYVEGNKTTPVAYWYDGNRLPASLVVHRKGLSDSDWPRGVPFLTRYLQTARKYEKYMLNVEDKLELSNAWVLWINYASATAAAAGRAANLRTTDTESDPNRQKRLKGGTVFRTSGADTKAEFMGPKLDGARAEDGRVYDLQCARAGNLAENTVSGNAEYNNRASIEVAQDPQTRGVETKQTSAGNDLRALWRFVIRYGKENAGLRADAPEECTYEPPPIISRNEYEQAQALDLDVTHGLSGATYLRKRGYDPDLEQAQRDMEAKANQQRAEDAMGTEMDADAQADDAEANGEDADEPADASDGDE